MGIKFRAIVPPKNQIKTFKDFAVGFEIAGAKVSSRGLRMFEKTVQSWETDVAFIRRKTATRPTLKYVVYTENEVYYYVNAGTPPHPIEPKFAPALRFLSDYAAKTKPGVAFSYPGGARGDVVFAKYVEHPGTEPRKFDEVIAKEMQRLYGQFCLEELERIARR